MRHSRTTLAGASLLEAVILLAILATVAALVLPVVVKVREASARTKCPCNLKQLGLAVHNYASACKGAC